MVEILVTLVELSAAFAMIFGFTFFMNRGGQNDHTLQPLRVPVRIIRRNRR